MRATHDQRAAGRGDERRADEQRPVGRARAAARARRPSASPRRGRPRAAISSAAGDEPADEPERRAADARSRRWRRSARGSTPCASRSSSSPRSSRRSATATSSEAEQRERERHEAACRQRVERAAGERVVRSPCSSACARRDPEQRERRPPQRGRDARALAGRGRDHTSPGRPRPGSPRRARPRARPRRRSAKSPSSVGNRAPVADGADQQLPAADRDGEQAVRPAAAASAG